MRRYLKVKELNYKNRFSSEARFDGFVVRLFGGRLGRAGRRGSQVVERHCRWRLVVLVGRAPYLALVLAEFLYQVFGEIVRIHEEVFQVLVLKVLEYANHRVDEQLEFADDYSVPDASNDERRGDTVCIRTRKRKR